MSMKNPLTPAGIEPATFRFVAQHLNHCATAVPTRSSIIALAHWYNKRVKADGSSLYTKSYNLHTEIRAELNICSNFCACYDVTPCV